LNGLASVFQKWTSGNKDISEEEHNGWKRYYDVLIERALKASAEGKNCAITFVCYIKYVRDYIRERIPDIKFIHLKVDEEILLGLAVSRTQKMAAQVGMTIEQMWKLPRPDIVLARE